MPDPPPASCDSPTPSLRERVRGGERVLGTFVQTPTPVVPELLGHLGVDFVCLDQEHSAMGPETVQALVAGAGLGAVPALVRTADGSAAQIGAALDAGAAGVLVPRVESAAAAATVVRGARYPPAGARGLGPGRAARYGLAIADALARANDESLVGVQVETQAAVEALDGILAVEGLDLVFVGPGDLAASLGVDGDELDAVVADVVARTVAAGLVAGVFALDEARAAAWLRGDVGVLVVGSDLAFLADSVERTFAGLREPPTR